jgi:hypothetical protein
MTHRGVNLPGNCAQKSDSGIARLCGCSRSSSSRYNVASQFRHCRLDESKWRNRGLCKVFVHDSRAGLTVIPRQIACFKFCGDVHGPRCNRDVVLCCRFLHAASAMHSTSMLRKHSCFFHLIAVDSPYMFVVVPNLPLYQAISSTYPVT